MNARELAIELPSGGRVSALLLLPEAARALFVLAHGAGAGMRHAFMEDVAARLSARGVGTLRYQFPYMEAGSRRPDPRPRLLETARAAALLGVRLAGHRSVVAGGKSMGGRMTSQAAAEAALEGVSGLVFLGFPLHPAGRPGTERADHLARVRIPMLFLQGTRDSLADLTLLRPLVEKLERAELHVVEDGDHSFHVLKRSGRPSSEALDELADRVASFALGDGP